MSIQDNYQLSDEELDEIVISDFPFPIAINYKEMLETDDKKRRAELCVNAFFFGIRTITLAILIRYLTDSDADINSAELNRKIEQYLIRPYPSEWIDLLRSALEAYKERRDRFFIPELYDLYWGDDVTAQGKLEFWSVMERIARISNQIDYGTEADGTRVSPASKADELQELLRTLMRYFLFISNYELWLIVGKQEDWININVYSGVSIRNENFRVADIKSPPVNELREQRYYVSNRGMFSGHLLELDPLLIDPAFLVAHADRQDTGVYEGYYDQQEESQLGSKMTYLLIANNDTEDTKNTDLLAKFRYYYDVLLGEKDKALSAHLELTWEAVRTTLLNFSEKQMENALTKYYEDAYVDRVIITSHLTTFLSASQPAVVIIGDAGVGKTNVLVRVYKNQLLTNPDYAVLWLDGAELTTSRNIAYHILRIIDRDIPFEEGLPEDNEDANRRLRMLIKRPLFAGRKMVIIADALNESTKPNEAFVLMNDFINEFQEFDKFKVIISSRPEVWRFVKQNKLKTYHPSYYYRGQSAEGEIDEHIENDAFMMSRYTRAEQQVAFQLYSQRYNITGTRLQDLRPQLQMALRDPLLLRLTCEAYEPESQIPPNTLVDDVIPHLIETLINDPRKSLTASDVNSFLREKLVPQFVELTEVPVNRLTRTMLHEVVVDPGRDIRLDALVDNSDLLDDDTPVNRQFMNLMNTGWLSKSGAERNYEIRFRYEYFYDYFVGEYLAELSNRQSDQIAYIEDLVTKLQQAPYLWGPLRNLLATLLKTGHFELLENLARTDQPIQRDLVASVVDENYELFPDQLKALLLSWLRKPGTTNLAPQAATQLAVKHQLDDLIVEALAHRREGIRAYASEQMYELWKAPNGQSIAFKCLEALSNKVRLYRLRRNVDFLESLLNSSLIIVMRDYVSKGAHDFDVLRTFQQNVWQPAIRRLFSVIPSARLRRFLLRLGIGFAVRSLEAMSKAGQNILSMPDARAFFPASAYRKEVFSRILPHIHAAAKPPDLESLDEYAAYLQELIAKEDNDYLTTALGLATLVAHVFGDPEGSANIIRQLIVNMENVYPPTVSPDAPTASSWLHMIIFPLSNLPYVDMDIEQASRLLTILSEITIIAEERYLSAIKFPSGETRRTSLMADSVVFSYALNLPLGYETLQHLISSALERDDLEQINRYIAHLAEAISYHQLPKAALRAIYDIVMLLQPHLQELKRAKVATAKEDGSNAYDKFWDHFVEKVTLGAAAFKHDLIDFVAQFEDHQMDNDVKTRILNAQPKEDLGLQLAEAGLIYLRHVLRNEDSTVREFFQWVFERALVVKSLNIWVVDFIVYLANLVYGGQLFAAFDDEKAT
jgi:GTPase SAR1 family protein